MITPLGAFSLRESAMFGFGQRHSREYDGALPLAFCLEPTWEPVGVTVTQPAPDRVVLDGPTAAHAQALRVLSLDVDARTYDALPDPLIQRLQAVAPGLRPPLFHSAYEAAAWCVLQARRPMRTATGIRDRLSREHGTVLPEGLCFPTPEQLLAVTSFPGLDDVRLGRLHGIARAALDGDLDTAASRALAPAEALVRLKKLPGIGDFSAQLIVVRTLGHTDVLPAEEKHALAAVGSLYGFGRPATQDELDEVAEAWKPWRTWVLVLIRVAAGRLTPLG